ncbi:hypothetical protein BV394_13820 [Brevirhabdus pacifica]|uniref:Uncharacterized protein n=1 Tax=Brevirhabdus pacifica TaxID=1267768 RepID=A0A1U7DL12_9RHOB|nr:hypothetical protein [Brevirhabdus pacifica]APX90662.1 hypothetical protein BV394_13820 [Brevirhabdus pacifica]OWU78353.1 hypothetical protein ATO5_05645 [Loktanella sp. 22II-4b]PJJ85191.1 hypothetical protein CLV77_2057 [Brevirhabdus pacifica]
MDRPALQLHIGVHKTATTHLQKSLRNNQSLLKTVGTRFLPPGQYRKTLAPLHAALRDGGPEAELRDQAATLVHGAAQGCPRLVLSDENIVGNLPRVARGAHLYPWSPGRVARTCALFEGHELTLFLAIRNVARFLPSAYSESLLHGPYQGFARFVSNTDPADLRWSTMIERLLEELGGLPLVVWRYEDYAAHRDDIARAVIGAPLPEGFEFLDRRTRPGLTADAHVLLDRWAEDGRDLRDERLIAHAAQMCPPGPDHAPFRPLPEEVVEECGRNYAADWDRIAALPGVTCLGHSTAGGWSL